MSEEPEDISPSGSPIYHHKERTIPFQPTHGDGEVIDAIGDHIEKHLGKVEMVYHEIISDLVHIDVHIVSPTDDRPFYTLITSGMSEAPMTVPDGAEEFRFAELAISLPATWKLGLNQPDDEKSPLKEERNYWPIRLLKASARMPHEYDTWLGFGHTLAASDSGEPYAPDTKMNAVILLPAITTPESFWKLETPSRSTFFWGLYPLYPEELAFKLKHGSDALIEKFQDADVTDLLDPQRKNTCVKKRFWFF